MNNRKPGIALILCSLLMGGFLMSRPSQKPGDIGTPSGKSTIDPKLMNACQVAFPKGKFGEIVVIDPRNGHVLADFSTPDPTAEDQRELSETPTQPGVSLFPIVALSGSPMRIDAKIFHCGGGKKFGAKLMKC